MASNHSTFDTTKLLAVCERHPYQGSDVVVPEPYVPYLPKTPSGWNGILVVAIAQNLSDTNRSYRDWLEALEPTDRWNRLRIDSSPVSGIGIGPWDDGTIKLCVAALRGVEAIGQVAVSNAVLWSGRQSGMNESLSEGAKAASVSVWREMLEVMNPTEVVTFGAVAREVMKRTGVSKRGLADMPGPFSRNYNVSFRMDVDRLLSAFPEVARAWKSLSGHVQVDNEAMAIHCACACVSRELSRSR